MGEEPGTSGTTVSGSENPEQIRKEIDETREQLGDTVEALAAKTDVKKQAKRKVAEAKATAAEKRDEALARAEQVVDKAREASPETARVAAVQTSEKARQNPVPLAVAGAFAAGFLIGRIGSRR